ncbi:PulJ/GspJ family protein [Ottowia sp.]|uniref:PulJ/GspJ family protein n=1 Tax=Ottowia sp. TaxID=1898956 RepID=UPI003A872715
MIKAIYLIANNACASSVKGQFGFKKNGPFTPVKGFTLVEVLVALTIMAVMAALTWRGIDGMLRAQEATHRYSDDVLTLQAGLTQWQADLDAMMSWPNASGTLPVSAASRRSLDWNGNVLRITRMMTDVPSAGLRVVAWTRRGDGQWLRWQSAPLRSQTAWQSAWDAALGWSQSAPTGLQNSGAQAVAVATLNDWQLQYFRNNAWTNAQSSSAASATNTYTLPDGVRLMMTLAPGQALAGSMVIDWVRPDFGALP